MAEKEKTTQKPQANPRTYLISSTQLVTLMKYLMNQKYGEVKTIMDMLSTLKQLDPRVGPDFVADKGEANGGKNKDQKELKKFAGILFELKVGLSKDSMIVIDYGGKPVSKIREALKGYPYHGNLCASVINHCNSIGKKLEDEVRKIIQSI